MTRRAVHHALLALAHLASTCHLVQCAGCGGWYTQADISSHSC